MKNNIEDVILFQLDKTSKVAKQYSQKELDRLGLGITVEQWIILKIIEESNEISQKEIADKSMRDPASITRTLHLLEKKLLIKREQIAGNKRKYNIVLTKEGKLFVQKNMKEITKLRKLSVHGITKKELMELSQILNKIQSNMS